MNQESAQRRLADFLTKNPDISPDKGFAISQSSAVTIDGDTFFTFHWVEAESGRSARGGYMYFVFPDGRILGGGGSASPYTIEDAYRRWKTTDADERA